MIFLRYHKHLRGSGISGISGISQGLSASLRKCASYMRKVIQQLGQNWAELWLTHHITFLFEETPRENWKLRKRAFLSIKSPGVRFQFSLTKTTLQLFLSKVDASSHGIYGLLLSGRYSQTRYGAPS